MDKLTLLLQKEIITPYDHATYMIFHVSENGRDYLRRIIEMIFFQEPHISKSDNFAWRDGRCSIWREIKITIDFINEKLREVTDDNEDKHRDRNSDEFSFYGNDAIPNCRNTTTGSTTVKG